VPGELVVSHFQVLIRNQSPGVWGERLWGRGVGGFSLPSFFKFGGRKRSGGSISVGLMQGWVRMEP